MAASVAAHWYQQELGTPTSDEAPARFPFLRLPYKRHDSSNNARQARPTSSRSAKSFRRSSSAPPQKVVRRSSITMQTVMPPESPPPTMKPPTKSRTSYWRRKLGVQLIPPLAYYGWGSAEEVKRVAQQSKPTNNIPPNVRTATTDVDEIDEKDADDMILLTEMRAPSALGGRTLVDDPDDGEWPLRDTSH